MQRKNKEHYVNKDSVKRRISGAFSFRTVTLCLAMLFLLIFGCLGRVAYIMLTRGEEYRQLAADNQLRDTTVKAARGTIYDCNMSLLAASEPCRNLCVNSYRLNLKFTKL